MNSIVRKQAVIWNQRLKACMEGTNMTYTQCSLAAAMNKKYKTSFTQTSVSRWLSVGNTNKQNKSGETGFPEYETMILIARFFNVDVGYLTGETDSEEFNLEKASTYIGANDNTVLSFRRMTHACQDCSSPLWQKMRVSFNHLFGSSTFFELFCRLYELFDYSPISGVSEIHKFEYEEEAHSYALDVNDSISLARFKVHERFFQMLDELYPYSKSSDFLMEDEED